MSTDDCGAFTGAHAHIRVCQIAICLIASLTVGGCAWFHELSNLDTGSRLPKSLGESSTGYGYVPVDSLPVEATLGNQSCVPWYEQLAAKEQHGIHWYYEFKPPYKGLNPYKPLTKSLPDLNVRFAVGKFSQSAGFSFGPAKLTEKGSSYRAVLDYINVDAIPVTMIISAEVNNEPTSITTAIEAAAKVSGNEIVTFAASTTGTNSRSPLPQGAQLVTIPVYVGVGLRLSADVRALAGGIALTSLDSIGADAQANKLIGTLTVQTIGITGPAVDTEVPLPSRLDQTTIENAVLSIGSIRAVVFKGAQDGTVLLTPRVVGIYSPLGSTPSLINAIYAELARDPPKWDRPCRALPSIPAPHGNQQNKTAATSSRVPRTSFESKG